MSSAVNDLHQWGLPNAYDSEFEYIESDLKEIQAYLKLANVSINGDDEQYLRDYRSVDNQYHW